MEWGRKAEVASLEEREEFSEKKVKKRLLIE
jgi:hypothetical protein